MLINRLTVNSLARQEDSHALIHAARRAVRTTGHLRIDMSNANPIFPNGAVPWVVGQRYFQELGLRVTYDGLSENARKMGVASPTSAADLKSGQAVLNRVWVYRNETEGMRLATAFVDALEEKIQFGPGTSHSLNWCLWEVMDNVFQHSKASEGVAMVQLHYKSKHCAIAVADGGIGIHRSFKEGGVYGVPDAYQAIQKAIQERVTSKTKNAGNGLYGLMRVVGAAGGELSIHSGRGRLLYRDHRLSGDSDTSVGALLDLENHHGTAVDWQFDTKKPVRLEDQLGLKESPDLRLESLEDDTGRVVLRVVDFEEGLGSRRSAEMVRTRLMNVFAQGAVRITLDFSDVTLVSSSFADEVLGKLALRMGILQFMGKFELINMSELVRSLIDRAIQHRLQEGDDESPAAFR